MAPERVGGSALLRRSATQLVEHTDRFSDRARALFYARLAFLALGLGVLAVPSWTAYLGASGTVAFVIYFCVIAYSVLNYLLLDDMRFGKTVTFATLNLDLAVLTTLVLATGGLQSPLMGAQVVFTIFFALLFPRLIAILPPLMMLPVVARVDRRLSDEGFASIDLFLLLWYAALDFIAVYVLVYLNRRDKGRLKELQGLSHMREEALITEERLRMAREIHDGIGGTLSTLIIQSEYIHRLATDPRLKQEITDLKSQAEEAIDELRRSLLMMRRDFDLHQALEDHLNRFSERNRMPSSIRFLGNRRRLPSEMQLTVFRILQECLANVQKHAEAAHVEVALKYDGDLVLLAVNDDGKGFDPTAKKAGHYGLINMYERTKKYQGTVDVKSAVGAGTKVHVSLAIPTEGSHMAEIPSGVARDAT